MPDIRSDKLNVKISAKGGELYSVKNNAGHEYIWQADPEVWPRHAPVLFPIVGRLRGDGYSFEGVRYPMGQHGFARDLDFEINTSDTTSCEMELRSSENSRLKYPFDFIFKTLYQVHNDVLTITHRVTNPSETSLFYSVGAHPGFNCPMLPGETFEDYYIEFERENYLLTALQDGLRLEAKKQLILPDRKLFMSNNLFDQDALVFENGQINRVSLCAVRSGPKITLCCENWPYFGIWSKKGCRRFVCLEPWHGIADRASTTGHFETKEGLIRLAPKSEFGCHYTLQFH